MSSLRGFPTFFLTSKLLQSFSSKNMRSPQSLSAWLRETFAACLLNIAWNAQKICKQTLINLESSNASIQISFFFPPLPKKSKSSCFAECFSIHAWADSRVAWAQGHGNIYAQGSMRQLLDASLLVAHTKKIILKILTHRCEVVWVEADGT